MNTAQATGRCSYCVELNLHKPQTTRRGKKKEENLPSAALHSPKSETQEAQPVRCCSSFRPFQRRQGRRLSARRVGDKGSGCGQPAPVCLLLFNLCYLPGQVDVEPNGSMIARRNQEELQAEERCTSRNKKTERGRERKQGNECRAQLSGRSAATVWRRCSKARPQSLHWW